MAIRNIILLSHAGAGKTSLAEAMLFTSGAISRLGRVDDGNTVSDYEPEEIKRKTSLNLSLLPFQWQGVKVNLLDAPGYADFYGEVKAGLRVADSAILVICAASGVEVGTEEMWSFLEEAGLPRLIFINKMDRENANFERVLEEIRNRLTSNCFPVQLPIGAQAEFKGVVDLIAGKAFLKDGGEAPVPPEMEEAVASSREKLVESAIESDDELISRYLEGEEIGEEEIRKALKESIKERRIVPVFVGSSLQLIGVSSLMDAIVNYLPSPQEAPPARATNPATGDQIILEASPQGPLAVLVFKTAADPYVGKLSYFRVYSGTLSSNSQAWNVNKGEMERIGQLFSIRGKSQEGVPQVEAGDLGAVAKLSVTSTGDTLCAREQPLVLEPPSFPQPVISMAMHPKTKADLDKMGTVLPRLLEEDPALQIRREQDTGETLLCGLGETHLEVAMERMQRKFGVEVKLDIPKIPYKETITTSVRADYRHKKQTGGHGQFAHVFLELEPLPRGSGIQFEERLVGQNMSRSYVPAVEKGIYEAAQEGVLAGYPVVDVKAVLYDGKDHPVDSSDICFKIAGAYAFKRGLEQAKPLLLEPIVKLKVKVPEPLTGDIISNLNTKRARVMGITPEGSYNIIEALAPLAEVQNYATDLRSLTQGRGRFTLEFSHYEEVPPHLTQKIVAEKKGSKAG